MRHTNQDPKISSDVVLQNAWATLSGPPVSPSVLTQAFRAANLSSFHAQTLMNRWATLGIIEISCRQESISGVPSNISTLSLTKKGREFLRSHVGTKP